MLLTPHILAGVAVFTQTQNPILGLIFVVLCHYLLDFPPQTEYSIDRIKSRQWKESAPDFLKVFLDIALGLFVIVLIVGFTPLILTAAFLAIFPDGLTLLHHIFPSNRLLKRHLKIHAKINATCADKKIPAFWGIVSQVIVIVLAIYFLI